MSASPEVSPETLRSELNSLRRLGGFVILGVLLFENWGQWRVALMLGATGVVTGLTNTVLVDQVGRRWNHLWAETLRMAVNAVLFAVIGPATRWSVILWLYIPFNMLWFDGRGWERVRAIVYLAVIPVVALLQGCEPIMPLAFTVLGSITFLVADKRTMLHQTMLREVLQQREQLQKAHERALEQEKLSSLGMMAAGVAHEINNPMSFVTSNVNSLHKELQRRQEGLPEPLREYVTEVLPETMDGIRRVNAIVSDLRRFSRGDAEIPTEYDLNDEARAALRIAHGQLSHCKVEAELGEVGRMVGRPRQIAQVLVNLLVNAGQATAAGGRVHLTTVREGEQVRVEVRDTGMGMPPEVLARLFQPFFTTKPLGMGTGLGLAVVHGIVTAHGGRIAVRSQPGEGTCFTVLLPCEPPSEQAMAQGG